MILTVERKIIRPRGFHRRRRIFPAYGGFRAAGSPPIGLHYQGPTVSFARVTFPGTAVWFVPAGVTSIDVLVVGAGSAGVDSFDSFGLFPLPSGGGGGGGIVVTNGIPVVPGHQLEAIIGAGGIFGGIPQGGTTLLRNNTLGGITIAGPGGAGGTCGTGGLGLGPPPVDGTANNGNGAGGTGSPIDGPYPPSNPDGAGFIGGDGAAGASIDECAGGGGGGAGAVGANAVVGGGGSPGIPGNGGAGAVPAPSSFGAWGTDIGENGFFGGGGPAKDGRLAGWAISAPGVGNGADNTGGGGGYSLVGGTDGFSGFVAIIHAL